VKKALLLISLIVGLSTSTLAQLNEFQSGNIISSSQMNENFKYLEGMVKGRATTVDCGTSGSGSGVSEAILNGYTEITIVGQCYENIMLAVWQGLSDRTRTSNTYSPKFLRLIGADANSKLVDSSGNTKNLIRVDATTLVIDNLTLSGGDYGIGGFRNSNVLLSGVTIENFAQRGVSIHDSSFLGVDDGGLIINGASNPDYGVLLVNGASAWISTQNISNVKHGLVISAGSVAYCGSLSIDTVERGVRLISSRLLIYENASIKNSTDTSISSYDSGLNSTQGSFIISPISSGIAIDADRSTFDVRNFVVNGNSSANNPVINIRTSGVHVDNFTVSGSGSHGISFEGSSGYISNFTSRGNAGSGAYLAGSHIGVGLFVAEDNGEHGIRLSRNSSLNGGWKDPNDSTLPEYMIELRNNGRSGIEVSRNSSLEINNAHIEGNGESGVDGRRGAYLNIQDSKISANSEDGISVSRNSYLDLANTEVSNNQNRGVNLSSFSMLDFGTNNSGVNTLINSNTSGGIDVGNNAIVEFDENVNLTLSSNGQSIILGTGVKMSVGSATISTDQEILCWSDYAVEPNNEANIQSSDLPIIHFSYNTNLPPISSNCRIQTPN
jgi:hypothetical protein